MSSSRVSVQGLSKVFGRHALGRRKGVATGGTGALQHLLKQTLRRSDRMVLPDRGDKRYLWALDEVSFDVNPGEVVGIIGRNGAGKSTLLKILARVLHPTSGRVLIHGRVVSMLELGVGLAPELTVRQNIHVQGRLAGIPGRQISRAEDEILAFSGLAAFADAPLRLCPSGSPVQLAFAAMIGLGADVVLADEVLAVGDSEFRRACEARVSQAGESGESVLFVSHDMAAIRRICTRVIWIDRGRIVQNGPTEVVVAAYVSELLAGRLVPSPADVNAKPCALLDFGLFDGNRVQTGALQLTEPGFIGCLFRAQTGVTVVAELTLTHRKKVVLATRSEPIPSRGPTTFWAGVAIPADFLNEQQYQTRIRLHAKRLTDTEYTLAAEERLEFSAMNPHPERSVWNDWPWGRGGLISPRLAWSVRPGSSDIRQMSA